MSTLIRNIGILDARQAKPEQINEIGKIENVGALVINEANKTEFMKISMLNVGRILELDDDYKLLTGECEITKQMLEDAEKGVKLCVVGKVAVDEDIPLELLKENLLGLYLVGLAEVPEKLYGAFMSATKDVIGKVVTSTGSGKKNIGKINLTDAYLNGLEDGSELSVVGNVIFSEDIDAELFLKKIKKLSVIGVIKCLDEQEEMLHKVLDDNPATRLRILKKDYHYVQSGTRLDAFAMMTITKLVISCSGQLFLDEEVTSDIIKEKNFTFDAQGAIYFPKTIMAELATRLTQGTRGLPHEPGKLEVFSEQQNLTNARLNAMQDNSTLVVLGELEIDKDVTTENVTTKVGILDNYGKIDAEKDVASILQSKLRKNEGAIEIKGSEDSDEDGITYETIIENSGTYKL